MVKRKNNIKKILISLSMFLLTLIMLFATFATTNFSNVFAEDETVYTTALEDLQKDKTFNVADYPLVENDASLSVISIAESVNKELFIYVYQPCKNLIKATSINLSTNENGSDRHLYDLEFLNSSSTLCKYKVVDFQVSNDEIRYYDISSIYRPFNSIYDGSMPDGQVINEVSFDVGCLWKAKTDANGVVYDLTQTEVVHITDKFAGFVRYEDGFHLFPTFTAVDSHFVAFNTDKKIEELYSVRVFFEKQECHTNNWGVTDFGDVVSENVLINSSDIVSYTGNYGWVHYNYEWNRIQTVDEFLTETDINDVYECGIFDVGVSSSLNDEAIKNLNSKTWVLRFYETSFGHIHQNVLITDLMTLVNNISIIELTFKSEGTVLTLGTVDNKQSGSDVPVNDFETSVLVPEWLSRLLEVLKWVILGVLIISLIVICWPVISVVLKFLMKCIAWVLKGIWWLISWPFKKIKERSSK